MLILPPLEWGRPLHLKTSPGCYHLLISAQLTHSPPEVLAHWHDTVLGYVAETK